MSEIDPRQTIGSQITQALGTGSGVNIQELATTLANAESISGIQAVEEKKAVSEVAISGYGVLKSSVAALMRSFEALEDADGLLNKSAASSEPEGIEVEMIAESLAPAGTTEIEVLALARSQQNALMQNSNPFASATAAISSGPFNLSVSTKGPTELNDMAITVSNPTPQGIVDAMNANTAQTGIRAKLLRPEYNEEHVIVVLEGKPGGANIFEVTNSLTGAETITGGDADEAQRDAGDLRVMMGGLEVRRDNNTPTDLIEGVRLTFKKEIDPVSSTAVKANIVINEDAGSLEDKLGDIIQAHNDFLTLADYLTGERDPDDELAGSLSNEKSQMGMLKRTVRSAVGSTSQTSSNGFGTLRQLGIDTKLGGELELDRARYDIAIAENFDDVRTMLTADTTNQSRFSPAPKGLAQSIALTFRDVVSEDGWIESEAQGSVADVARYEDQLASLNERYESAKMRYLKQFAAMETLVQRSNSMGDYLTGQFKAMEGAYNKG